MSIGSQTRKAREARYWTQTGLARECGLTSAAISLIEADERSPNTKTLRKIAIALGRSLDWLCEIGVTSDDRRKRLRAINQAVYDAEAEAGIQRRIIVPKGWRVRWEHGQHIRRGVVIEHGSDGDLFVTSASSGKRVKTMCSYLTRIEPPK